jgi:hypothetical protein
LRRSDVCEALLAEAIRRNRQPKGPDLPLAGNLRGAPPVVEAIQKENAETLLKKLIELNDPRYIPAGFILAVMLERKRILKVKEQIVHEGGAPSFTSSQRPARCSPSPIPTCI